MAHIVLALKYRPQTFSEIVGQEHVTKTLVNAIKMNRIGHAYLFSGPRGVGKTSTARIFAKAINCEKGISSTFCNQCSTCKEIADGRSIDVLEIDGASNRGIDEIRQLRENVKFGTAGSQYKIYIIDEVHMLTTEAFNALLKTLEEPPAHIIFIFATTQSYKVPLTILSRCQHFTFRRILPQEIITHLKLIATKENLKITEDALSLIALSAEGSIRDAESLLEQLISFCEEEITLSEVTAMLGKVEHQALFKLTHLIIKNEIGKAFDLLNDLINVGIDITQFIKDIKLHLRNLLLIKIIKNPIDFVELKMFYPEFKEQSNEFSSDVLIKMIQLISNLELQLKQTSYSKILLELAVIELSKIFHTPSFDNLTERITALEEKIGEKPILIKETAEEITILDEKDEAPFEIENSMAGNFLNLSSHWEEIVAKVTEKKRIIGAFLAIGQLLRIENNHLIIGFGKEFLYNKEQVEKKTNLKIIEQTITEIFKCEYKIKCIFGEISYKEKVNLPSCVDEKEHILEKEPIIKKTVEIFKGKVMEIKKQGGFYKK